MILKRNIVASFITWFLITLGATIALLSLLNINLFDVKTTWLTLTVSAVLTLVYAVFFLMQYGEETSRLTRDIDKILTNETPELERLQPLSKRMQEMSLELQNLSVTQNVEHVRLWRLNVFGFHVNSMIQLVRNYLRRR